METNEEPINPKYLEYVKKVSEAITKRTGYNSPLCTPWDSFDDMIIDLHREMIDIDVKDNSIPQ